MSDRRPSASIAKAILDILRMSARPLGAHEIAAATAGMGAGIAAAQVYRTLRRLVEVGVALRIESRNAFMPRTLANPMLLICTDCRVVSEIDDDGIADSIAARLAGRDFESRRAILEIEGICEDCARQAFQHARPSQT